MKKITVLLLASVFVFFGLTFLKYEKRIAESEAMLEEGDYQKAAAGAEAVEKSYYGWFLRQTKIPFVYSVQYGRLQAIKGVALYESGETNKAKRVFFEIKTSEQLKGDRNLQILARYNLAKILGEEGDFINSEWEYIETLKIDPDHYKAKVNLELWALMKKKAGMDDKDKDSPEKRKLGLRDLIIDLWSKDKKKDDTKKSVPRW